MLSWEVAGSQQRPGVGILLHDILSAWKEIAGFIGVSSSVANEDRAAWSVEVLSNHNSHLLHHFCRSDPQGCLLFGISQLWSIPVRPLGSNGPRHSLLALTSRNQHGSWSQLFLAYRIRRETKGPVFAKWLKCLLLKAFPSPGSVDCCFWPATAPHLATGQAALGRKESVGL